MLFLSQVDVHTGAHGTHTVAGLLCRRWSHVCNDNNNTTTNNTHEVTSLARSLSLSMRVHRQTPYRQPSVGVGADNAAAGETESPVPSTSPEGDGSLRSRVVGSSNMIWGMQAILETEDDEETGQDLV